MKTFCAILAIMKALLAYAREEIYSKVIIILIFNRTFPLTEYIMLLAQCIDRHVAWAHEHK